MDNTDDVVDMVTGGHPTKTQILRLMYTAYRKMENLHESHNKGSLKTEYFEKGILALYLWIKHDGESQVVEAFEALGPNAGWEELLTYGEDGEPEAQAELSKHRD